jgi:predicted Co/Zn/Cd cation transporter (cation efflux family)
MAVKAVLEGGREFHELRSISLYVYVSLSLCLSYAYDVNRFNNKNRPCAEDEKTKTAVMMGEIKSIRNT